MPWHIETVYVHSKEQNRSFKKEVESAIKGKQLVDIKYATVTDSDGNYAESAMIIYKSAS